MRQSSRAATVGATSRATSSWTPATGRMPWHAPTYCVLQSVVGQPMQLASMGHYEDHCRKDEGRWRFQKRLLTIEGKGPIPG